MKPGIYTTELWVSVLGLILSVLVLNGNLTQDQADTATEALVQLLPIVVIVIGYVWSRTRLKQGEQ